MKFAFFVFPVCLLSIITQAQHLLTEKQAVELALKNNPQIKVSELRVEKQQRLRPASLAFDNLEVIMQAPTTGGYAPSILQRLQFPTVYTNQIKLQKANIRVAESEKMITANNLVYSVRHNYNNLNFLIQKSRTLRRQDSIFSDILEVNDIRYKVGQISNLEKINSEAYYKQIQFTLMQTQADLQNAKRQIAILIGTPNDTTISTSGGLTKIEGYEVENAPDTTFPSNPLTNYYTQLQVASKRSLGLERSRRLPGLIGGYFNQLGPGTSTRYHWQFGVTIPIWFWAFQSRVGAARKDVEIAQSQFTYNNYQLKGEYSKALAQYKQYRQAVEYFETVGNQLSNEIIKAARESYRLGSIGYYIYLQNINQAFQIQYSYLEALKNYNESIITLQYIIGEQRF